jgi:hypothetical protein
VPRFDDGEYLRIECGGLGVIRHASVVRRSLALRLRSG